MTVIWYSQPSCLVHCYLLIWICIFVKSEVLVGKSWTVIMKPSFLGTHVCICMYLVSALWFLRFSYTTNFYGNNESNIDKTLDLWTHLWKKSIQSCTYVPYAVRYHQYTITCTLTFILQILKTIETNKGLYRLIYTEHVHLLKHLH